MHAKFEVRIFNHFGLAFNAQKLRGHVTLATPHFRKKIFSSHVGTFPRSMRAKFEVRIFSHFGASNLTPKKLRGHVTLATPPFTLF